MKPSVTIILSALLSSTLLLTSCSAQEGGSAGQQEDAAQKKDHRDDHKQGSEQHASESGQSDHNEENTNKADANKDDSDHNKNNQKDDNHQSRNENEGQTNKAEKSQNTKPGVIQNPTDILALVNKQYKLPADYVPDDLVEPEVRFPFDKDLPKKLMRKPAARALEKMFDAAENDGVYLFAQSGYRSYDRQKAIFASNAEEHGKKEANNFSAQAGESEHQTGLTMDITAKAVDFRLVTDFGATKAGKWVKKHASEFGFIIRYPKGKKDVTGYQYEPWHLRYVGNEAAKKIDERNITLEKYLGLE